MTKPRVPPFSVHFHLGEGTEIINTSDGEWSDRNLNYDSDCLTVWNKNPEFLRDERFMTAYREGMNSDHKFTRVAGADGDAHIEWRVHVACWAAWHARQLPGDFVECGVNTGILSLAVCRYIDFNSTAKSFYLFDTFCGIPDDQISSEERAMGRDEENAEFYEECYELAAGNFAAYPRARLVRGRIPDSLPSVEIDKVCYLSLDLNIAAPELAAIEYFWDRLVPGAPVLLDDYGWLAYKTQKEAMDDFAARRGVEILNLPTGQGLLIKP